MMTTWNKAAVAIHPEAFRSPQQLRSLCTVIFSLTEPGSERPCYGLTSRRSQMHHGRLQAYSNGRSYSWRSDSSSKETPLLHRSKTAYYDILRVSPNATLSQIKTAYYKQSFIHHPDKNPGNDQATKHFSEISEAYNVLRNISMRKKYDRGSLSLSDIERAERPSSKETPSRSEGSSQQQHQSRASQFSRARGKTMFDFDAFYQGHYGEELQRERNMRDKKEQFEEEERKKNLRRWKRGKVVEMSIAGIMAMVMVILASFGGN